MRIKTRGSFLARLGLAVVLGAFVGCASSTYQFALAPVQNRSRNENAVTTLTIGGEHPRLDRIESIVNYPAKKFQQWFPPKVPPLPPAEARQASVEKAQEYLLCNQLNDMHIDVREYDPAAQWKRLRANDRIHPVWKYTGGLVSHTQYTLLPDRVFHTDTYNPYTNTLSIGSTEPSSVLYQSAVAKVIRTKRYPGAFTTACYLPIVPLYRDVLVANDALSYARTRQDWLTERQLYPEIYGRFGADVISQTTSIIPGMSYLPFYYRPLMTIGGGLVGTATGRFVLRQRESEIRNLSVKPPEFDAIYR